MPLFHLHLWEGGACSVDELGAELPDQTSAVGMAMRSLGEMLADDLRSERELANRCIVVTDEGGSTLAQLTTAEVVRPLQSAPPARPVRAEPELRVTASHST